MKISNSYSFHIKSKELKEYINANKNFFTLDNEENLNRKDPYEILSEKIDSTKTKSPKLITTIDNMSNIRHKIHKYPKPKIKLPLIKTRKLLTEADLIVKKGKKLEGLSPIHIPVDIKVKQSVAINLKNNLIGKIIEKRNEIKLNEKNYINKINQRNEDYKKEYKNYLNLVEIGQKKQKEEENLYNKLKNDLVEKEKILNNEISENKMLLLNNKKMINELLIYKKYGQFLHKFFSQNFIFDKLKKFDGKNYKEVTEDIINIYENNKDDKNFYEMLLSPQGVYYFFMKWSNMEQGIRNELNKKNEILQELNDIEIIMSNDINNLSTKKNEVNKDKYLFDKNKKEQTLMVKELKEYYTITDIKRYLKYIIELSNLIASNKNEISKINTSAIKDKEIMEESDDICNKGIKLMEEKEKIINKYSDEIHEIINSGNNDDKKLIEKIINERRKLNIRVKQKELNNLKEKMKRKNAFKTIETQKIIIKGRKVAPKYPLFKHNNKGQDKKITANENLLSDYNDYICFSDEED